MYIQSDLVLRFYVVETLFLVGNDEFQCVGQTVVGVQSPAHPVYRVDELTADTRGEDGEQAEPTTIPRHY